MKRLIIATVLTTALAATSNSTGARGQTPADAPPHPPAAGQSGGGMMMGMMGGPQGMGNMPMMGNMMGVMMGAGAGMSVIDHVEGHIAFLHTELKITDAQATSWNAFADALRANAKKLGEARAASMSRIRSGQQQPLTLADRLDLEERWLTARLEGTRALKSTFAILYAQLSDEQKKTAGEILAPHMGMGMAPMMTGQ